MKAKKSLGQHWLKDKQILDSICMLADVQPDDTVLEIGPGHGSLTRTLLGKGADIVAVEFDDELAAGLVKNIKSDRLKVFSRDILKFDLTTLPVRYKVVANIPYYLTSNLIRVLCESKNPAQSITLLVQKEVAERLCAAAGNMSVLSISAQVYYECVPGPIVTADKFTPPPKVDSQIVNMTMRSKPLFGDLDKKLFFKIVKAGFSNRRKTLLNSLSGGLHISKDQTLDALGKLNIHPNTRAQELAIEDWVRLTEYLTR